MNCQDTLRRRASFDVPLFRPLSPEYFAKKGINLIGLAAKYLGERAGVRGLKRRQLPPHPNPLPLEFAVNAKRMEMPFARILGERGQSAQLQSALARDHVNTGISLAYASGYEIAQLQNLRVGLLKLPLCRLGKRTSRTGRIRLSMVRPILRSA